MDYFVTWSREAEISADRGGLLCCQDRDIAERAILRQLGNLDDATIEKYGGKFDVEGVLAGFESWRRKTFFDYLGKLRSMNLTCPFVDERIASLRFWEVQGGTDRIFNRDTTPSPDQKFAIRTIDLTGLPSTGPTDQIQVKVYEWNKVVFKSTYKFTSGRVSWNYNFPVPCEDGKPLFFEIWSVGYVGSSLLGMFTIYPEKPSRNGLVSFHDKIEWEVHERKAISRVGTATVTGMFLPA